MAFSNIRNLSQVQSRSWRWLGDDHRERTHEGSLDHDNVLLLVFNSLGPSSRKTNCASYVWFTNVRIRVKFRLVPGKTHNVLFFFFFLIKYLNISTDTRRQYPYLYFFMISICVKYYHDIILIKKHITFYILIHFNFPYDSDYGINVMKTRPNFSQNSRKLEKFHFFFEYLPLR